MDLGILTIKAITFLMFSLFSIAALGYALGRIQIKGVALGDSGVFIVALLYGCFFYDTLKEQLRVLFTGLSSSVEFVPSVGISYADNALKIIENLGLILFVTSVGFIAGPKFFGNFKKNFKSYVLLGLVVILSGAFTCVGCIFVGRLFIEPDAYEELTAMLVGLLSGSLTSTPAFSAAKSTVAEMYEGAVTVGHGIAYLFGVVGVVLFVQLMPKILKADMEKERLLLAELNRSANGGAEKKAYTGKLFSFDGHGFMPFALVAVLGILIGSIKIGTFSLTTTGGCLLVSLVFGHFGHFGPVNVMPSTHTLQTFRELGLMLFLIGAGVAGGAEFVQLFKLEYFLYGVVMTVVPLIVGYFFARYVLKLSLLNNLGSITGGMTSTPALGTLIGVSKTEDVAAAYAATYPVALIAVVLCSQFIIILFS